MNNLIAFFEIPSNDFYRAVNFYETVLKVKLSIVECEQEKMAFFSEGIGAISYAPDFHPSENGVLIHFYCSSIDQTLLEVSRNGGKTAIPKTKIEAEGKGYFAVFIDSEGNSIGIYSDN